MREDSDEGVAYEGRLQFSSLYPIFTNVLPWADSTVAPIHYKLNCSCFRAVTARSIPHSPSCPLAELND